MDDKERARVDYTLENLGDERFQEFCQAILVREHPGLQCFPVGQPDGGRDAVSFLEAPDLDGRRPFSVFQVKFVRKPQAEKNPHSWLTGAIEGELEKIKELISRGATAYYLLTNVPGTAHPDTGSIDKLDSILAPLVSAGASFQCYWRGDLLRRIEADWELKWAFPEILSGVDALRWILMNGLGEDKERRVSAVRSFLRRQFQTDEEVRFKQVELQNKLLDLFVDSPLRIRSSPQERRSRASSRNRFDAADDAHERGYVGAADALLGEYAFGPAPYVVIEGGPGQGKSTLTQYVCQMHRIRLLREEKLEKQLPKGHRVRSVRLPFRVELKDFAAWMNGENPFVGMDQRAVSAGPKSIEGFLAEQVLTLSGGVRFEVSDLHAVLRVSSVLLVLDGLDEVAEVHERRRVIDECRVGIARLKEIAASIKVVVTSRPAAFVNSPGFPRDEFAYYDLGALVEPLVSEYTEKWLSAKRLDQKTAAGIRKTLRTKLEQPHLRELARNPMQLAILLGLIHNRGVSLPDKRTALYTSYVELFLNREAEKSDVVRDYREILEGLHGYLGFYLHSESERGKNRAGIRADRFEKLIAEYLESEGRKPSLLDELRAGVVERVVFLVSRVQGLYEFEVQPLREYFAALHLYRTAPYSPQGRERRGTILDRFDALARNFYWLNVLRFFAGFFDKGELPALVDRLEDLFSSEGFRSTGYPSQLSAMLLGDRVFSQHAKSAKAVARLVAKGLDEGRLPTMMRRSSSFELSLEFAGDCGRDELAAALRDMVLAAKRRDRCRDLLVVHGANATLEEQRLLWLEMASQGSFSFEEWLEIGLYSSVLARMPAAELEPLLEGKVLTGGAIQFLLQARHSELLESKKVLVDVSRRAISDGSVMLWHAARTPLEALASYLSPHRFQYARYSGGGGSLVGYIKSSNRYSAFEDDSSVGYRALDGMGEVVEFIGVARSLVLRSQAEWASSVLLWNEFLASAEKVVGDCWALYRLGWESLFLARRASKQALYSLNDESIPICERLMSAVARRTSPAFWREQIGESVSAEQQARVLALLLGCASPKVLVELGEEIGVCANGLPLEYWRKLSDVSREIWGSVLGRDKVPALLDAYRASPRVVAALAWRVVGDSQGPVAAFLSRVRDPEPDVLRVNLRMLAWRRPVDEAEWRSFLAVVRKVYAAALTDVGDRYRGEYGAVPLEISKAISSRPQEYPQSLVMMADERMRMELGAGATPIKIVADEQRWWEDVDG